MEVKVMEKRKMTKEEIREYLLRSRELLEGDFLWRDEEDHQSSKVDPSLSQKHTDKDDE